MTDNRDQMNKTEFSPINPEINALKIKALTTEYVLEKIRSM